MYRRRIDHQPLKHFGYTRSSSRHKTLMAVHSAILLFPSLSTAMQHFFHRERLTVALWLAYEINQSRCIFSMFLTRLHVFNISRLFSSSGYHPISQTHALRREQEGDGGLDHRTQICPEMGNLWGGPDLPSSVLPNGFWNFKINCKAAKCSRRWLKDILLIREVAVRSKLEFSSLLFCCYFLWYMQSWSGTPNVLVWSGARRPRVLMMSWPVLVPSGLRPSLSLSVPPCQASQFNMEHFSGMHNWYACSHARPTFCNVCREALPGVTSHGLSCEGTAAHDALLECVTVGGLQALISGWGRFHVSYHQSSKAKTTEQGWAGA